MADEDSGKPIMTTAFAKCEELMSLKRQNEALSDALTRYRTELVRATSEKDRLRRRLKTARALGFDAENDDGDVDFTALDELVAYDEASITERQKPNPLDRNDDFSVLLADLTASSGEATGSKCTDDKLDKLLADLTASPLERAVKRPGMWVVVAALLTLVFAVKFRKTCGRALKMTWRHILSSAKHCKSVCVCAGIKAWKKYLEPILGSIVLCLQITIVGLGAIFIGWVGYHAYIETQHAKSNITSVVAEKDVPSSNDGREGELPFTASVAEPVDSPEASVSASEESAVERIEPVIEQF